MPSYYIKVTDRCNMHCRHCCMSSTMKGDDMTWETFVNATNVLFKYDKDANDRIWATLGGGEPTLNPLIVRMAERTREFFPHVTLGVVTNGTRMRRALKLLEMHKKENTDFDPDSEGGFSVRMSVDVFHKEWMVHPIVRQAYQDAGCTGGHFLTVHKVGRARNLPQAVDWYDKKKESPMCCGIVVQPNGDIRQCFCKDADIMGNVNDIAANGWTDSYRQYEVENADSCCHQWEDEQERRHPQQEKVS